jgi:hypothetical protein
MLADSHLMVGLSNQLTLDIGNQPSRAFERSRRIVECFLLPDQQQRRYLHAAQLLIRKRVLEDAWYEVGHLRRLTEISVSQVHLIGQAIHN